MRALVDTRPVSPIYFCAMAEGHIKPPYAGVKYCKGVRMVSTADDMNASYRSNFEDAHSIVDEFGDEHTTFIGIYDGHGGAGTCMQTARAASFKELQSVLNPQIRSHALHAMLLCPFRRPPGFTGILYRHCPFSSRAPSCQHSVRAGQQRYQTCGRVHESCVPAYRHGRQRLQ